MNKTQKNGVADQSKNAAEINISKEELYRKACTLTSLSNQLDLITDYLANVHVSSQQGDKTMILYFGRKLGTVVDNLEDIQEKVQDVSNAICPDEF
ncbi:hypothetical protein ACI3EJ_07650 [Ligilactobacillus acidipiscis]|uniref:hypothetical protein n=1 Tax=Ligilactobacillus acidipiscis TaxID=89059 RepID=UPI00386F0A5B